MKKNIIVVDIAMMKNMNVTTNTKNMNVTVDTIMKMATNVIVDTTTKMDMTT